jgi:hypothetical protein
MLKDELDCEEAVSYLQGCCPGFDGAQIECTDWPKGCNAGHAEWDESPAITEEQSACIRAESCSTLIATGVCARAQKAGPVWTGPPGGTKPDQVCP